MRGIVTLRDTVYDETGPKDILVGNVTKENGVYRVEVQDKDYVIPVEGVTGVCYTDKDLVWDTEEVEDIE